MSVRFTSSALSLPRAYAALDDSQSGGVVLFLGRVRPDRHGRRVVDGLLYEAHQPLAMRALTDLEKEVRSRFGARRVVIWHRMGVVPVGAPSIIVGVATAHRADAFSACRYAIDRLKTTAPIWKTDLPRRGRRPSKRLARRSAGRLD